MLKLSGILLGFAMLACMVGCGGGSSGQPTPTPTPFNTSSVTPSGVSVPIGGTQQFTGIGFPGTITWTISPSIGTIDSTGLYHAPATFPSPNNLTVTATSGSTTSSTSASVVFPNDNAGAQSAPVKLGSSGGNALDVGAKVCCIGTLGSLWTRADLPNPVILSNNHVFARSGQGTPGEAIGQPGQAACFNAPITVANLTEQATLVPAGTQQGRTGAAPSNVDAAIAQIIAGQVDTAGTILDLGASGTTTIAAAAPSATIATPALNMGVAKSGRTTGLTCSTISSINTSVTIAYETSCGTGVTAFNATYTGQVVVNGGNFSAGGDSGSLIVTKDSAEPVALLYGGSTTDTVANPIQDVIAAFKNGANALTPVGGADHAVSCAPENSAGAQVAGGLSTTVPISASEHTRVAAVQGHAATLLKDAAIEGFAVGASADSPGEGALIIKASRGLSTPVSPVIDGVRTRVVFDRASGAQPIIGQTEIDRATATKEAHVNEFMGKPGIQGMGVSISADNPAETAISIYVIEGTEHPPIPATIDGVRTRIFSGSQFKAY
ncbi:MAG TPA: Ig-like domain-containing protein [Candidatus Angelobacter sp.]|nr:Ig-like domain-containing protein [Candidatus Angelobacter sp.]